MTRADPLARPRTDIALHWQTIRDDALEGAARCAVVAYGGQLIEPRGTWGPLEYELTLLGITGTGLSLVDAARKWSTRALRMARHTPEPAAPAA